MSEKVRIVEVGLRDGLQNEKVVLPPQVIADAAVMIVDAGVRNLELGAFVRLEKMQGTGEVCELLRGKFGPDVFRSVLVPNKKGALIAADAGINEFAIFAAATEEFSQANINCSIEESFARFAPVMDIARDHGIRVRGYVSCAFGCPITGKPVEPSKVVPVVQRFIEMGCYEAVPSDTNGSGLPETTISLMRALKGVVPVERLALHCHDTNGQALPNIKAALQEGMRTFDSSLTGLGGCPYAPGASGNVATEKVVAMLHMMGFETGIDLEKLNQAGAFLRKALSAAPKSQSFFPPPLAGP